MLKPWQVFLLGFLSVFLSCHKEEQPEPAIRVGNVAISGEEFLQSYISFPQYRIHMTIREATERQANYLIENAYFSLAARQVGLDKDPQIQKIMQYITQKEVLIALFRDNVENKVVITEAEKKEAFSRMNKKLIVRHLLFPTLEEAEKARRLLMEGKETFESLARKVFRDPRLKENGGLLGAITFGDTDKDFENAAYALKKGEISLPVKSRYGYHLIRVDDIHIQVFRSENEYAQALPTIENELRIRKLDSLSAQFIKTTFPDLRIDIHAKGLKELVRAIQERLGPDLPDSLSVMAKPELTVPEIESLQQSVKKDEVLVTYNGKTLTVGEFLENLKTMLPYDRPNLRNLSQIQTSIVQFTRDQILYEYAVKQGYLKRKDVKRSIERRQQQLLAEEFRKRYMISAFRDRYPEEWARYYAALSEVKKKYKPEINRDVILQYFPNQDSLIREDPVPLFLKEIKF